MLDIIKNNQKLFLEKQDILMNSLFEEKSLDIENNWLAMKLSASEELINLLIELNIKYNDALRQRHTQPLEFIQFSFLRSSILDGFYPYRIDMDDGRWMASEWECCAYWKPNFVFDKIEEIKQILNYNFSRQSVAPLSYLDEMIIKLVENFQEAIISMLNEIIQKIVVDKRYNASIGSKVKIFCGEYLDKCWSLYNGGEA